MSYLEPIFLENIEKATVKTIFELGSRDLLDAHKLQDYYGCSVYAFECNPDCLEVCDTILASFHNDNIHLVKKAISLENAPITFYPFDLAKYDNMGASSMFKIDFSRRDPRDPDYKHPNPQIEISVEGTRLDTFMEHCGIDTVDLLCVDLQGYELNALKSLGKKLETAKYVLTECSTDSTYIGGALFAELAEYLAEAGFKYKYSNLFGYTYPEMDRCGFSEFDALFIRSYTFSHSKRPLRGQL